MDMYIVHVIVIKTNNTCNKCTCKIGLVYAHLVFRPASLAHKNSLEFLQYCMKIKASDMQVTPLQYSVKTFISHAEYLLQESRKISCSLSLNEL